MRFDKFKDCLLWGTVLVYVAVCFFVPTDMLALMPLTLIAVMCFWIVTVRPLYRVIFERKGRCF